MADVEHQLNQFLRKSPNLADGVYLTQTAVVFGDVTIGERSSVWYHTVIRGDINAIRIGHHTNIQDNSVVHVADDFPCIIGDYVTVGHSAIVHACTIGNETLVGMGACVLDGAVVGNQCLIGAKALVTPGTRIPDGAMVLGAPAKVVRELTPEQRADLRTWADKYVDNASYCLAHEINVGAPLSSYL